MGGFDRGHAGSGKNSNPKKWKKPTSKNAAGEKRRRVRENCKGGMTGRRRKKKKTHT